MPFFLRAQIAQAVTKLRGGRAEPAARRMSGLRGDTAHVAIGTVRQEGKPRHLSPAERLARPTVMAFALAFALTNVWFMFRAEWFAWDVNAYWDAAIRLRQGAELYIPYADVGAPEVYRYAPWFAWAWVPLTYLPREAVSAAWCLAMLVCSCLAVWPALRTRTQAGTAVALLTWPMMAYVSAGGNVHALMVASLVYGLRTPWAPAIIAACASLKAVPLAFALVYLGRRDFRRFGIAVGLTVLLVAPMLYYGVEDYTTDPGGAVLLSGWPWFAVIGAMCVATVFLARTRLAWLAAAATTVIAFPRWFIYDVSLILPGMQDGRREHATGNEPPTERAG